VLVLPISCETKSPESLRRDNLAEDLDQHGDLAKRKYRELLRFSDTSSSATSIPPERTGFRVAYVTLGRLEKSNSE